MSVSVTACSAPPGRLSEGPRWDARRGELLWVDILAGRLHRAVPDATGDLRGVQTLTVDRHLGAAAPATSGGHVLAAGTGFLRAEPDGTVRELAQPEAGRTDVRFNDGACDPQGRFWAGTMAYDDTPGKGVLYRLDPDGTATRMLDGLTISNGIGWTPDGATLVLADSGAGRVEAFAFDGAAGTLGERRTVFEAGEGQGTPDGLTVDDDGTVWVAFWDGGAVRRYDLDGRLLTEVALPVARPTSCAFGGPDRSALYVTTARDGLDKQALREQPDAGRVFRVDGLGARGPAAAEFAG